MTIAVFHLKDGHQSGGMLDPLNWHNGYYTKAIVVATDDVAVARKAVVDADPELKSLARKLPAWQRDTKCGDVFVGVEDDAADDDDDCSGFGEHGDTILVLNEKGDDFDYFT